MTQKAEKDETLATFLARQRKYVIAQIPTYVPIVGWLPKYPMAQLRPELIAGLTVWGVSVPTALAYAQLAGVPPQAGLYTMLAAMVAYAIFSTSRHIKVTATSTMAVTSAAVVAPLAGGDGSLYWSLTAELALIVGIMLLLAGIVRLGFIADFLAKPVVTGFVFGLAIVIAVGQLPKLFGVEGGSGNVFQQLAELVAQLPDTNLYTLAVGVGTIILIFLLRLWLPRIPPGLVALALGILLSAVLDLSQYGVSIVGDIPTGLPDVGLPALNIFDLPFLFAGAFGIVFLALGESLGAARAFATKHHYSINPNQELIAMGVANLGTGISQGMTVDASLSITATADAAGARSQLAGLIAAGLALLTILFIAPLFRELPNAVLGAIVIASVISLMDAPEIRRYLQVRRTDFILALTALFGVLLSNVLTGLALAVFLSLVFVLYRASRAYVAVLGKVPGRVAAYGDIVRHPEYEQIPGLLIFRLDAPLFFANANVADNEVREQIANSKPRPQAIILDLGATADFDVASADMLRDLVSELRDTHIETLLAQVRGPMRDRMRRIHLMEFIGEERIFFSVEGAVTYYLQHYASEASAAGDASDQAKGGENADSKQR